MAFGRRPYHPVHPVDLPLLIRETDHLLRRIIPERIELVEQNEPVKIQCQFCSERYELSIEECSAAWNQNSA